LGILLLICGYIISDKPDSLSVMHFDLSAEHVITAVDKGNNAKQIVIKSAEVEHGNRKASTSKFFKYTVVLQKLQFDFPFAPIVLGQVKYPSKDTYYYLFSREINPPPPKSC
jgi:hypothetical protein